MIDRQVLRGFLANVDVVPPLVVKFQFNPQSLTDTKEPVYANRRDGLSRGGTRLVYTGDGPRRISFDLRLHGLERGLDLTNPTPVDNGISTELAKLRSFLYPREDATSVVAAFTTSGGGGRRLVAPPTCLFGFGATVLECVVTNLQIVETQHNSALAPVRADISVTLQVIETDTRGLALQDRRRRLALATKGLAGLPPIGGLP